MLRFRPIKTQYSMKLERNKKQEEWCVKETVCKFLGSPKNTLAVLSRTVFCEWRAHCFPPLIKPAKQNTHSIVLVVSLAVPIRKSIGSNLKRRCLLYLICFNKETVESNKMNYNRTGTKLNEEIPTETWLNKNGEGRKSNSSNNFSMKLQSVGGSGSGGGIENEQPSASSSSSSSNNNQFQKPLAAGGGKNKIVVKVDKKSTMIHHESTTSRDIRHKFPSFVNAEPALLLQRNDVTEDDDDHQHHPKAKAKPAAAGGGGGENNVFLQKHPSIVSLRNRGKASWPPPSSGTKLSSSSPTSSSPARPPVRTFSPHWLKAAHQKIAPTLLVGGNSSNETNLQDLSGSNGQHHHHQQQQQQRRRRRGSTGSEVSDPLFMMTNRRNKMIQMMNVGGSSQRSFDDFSMADYTSIGESCLDYADDFTETSSVATSSVDLNRPIRGGVIAIGVMASPASSFVTESPSDTTPKVDNTTSPSISPQRNKKQLKNEEIISEVVAKDLAEEEHNMKMKLSGNCRPNARERRRSSPNLSTSAAAARRSLLSNNNNDAAVKRRARSSLTGKVEPRPSFLASLQKEATSSTIAEEPENYTGATASMPPRGMLPRGTSIRNIDSTESRTRGCGTPRLDGCRKASVDSNLNIVDRNIADRQAKARAAMGASGSSTRRLSAVRRSSSGTAPSPSLGLHRKKPAIDDATVEDEDFEDCKPPSRLSSMVSTGSGLELDEKTRNDIIMASSSHRASGRRRSSSSSITSAEADIAAKRRASSSKHSGVSRRQPSLDSVDSASIPRVASLARRTTSSGDAIRPSDDKSSLRITPPVAASSSARARANRPSDEKAAFRRESDIGVAVSRRPGAHAASDQDVPNNSKTNTEGASLASGDCRQLLESEKSELPFSPIMTSDIAEEDDNNSEANDLEAQAGVPVLLPGAFAVSSRDQDDDAGYDSGFEEDTVANVPELATAISSEQGDSPVVLRPNVPDAPLQAELYEDNIVDGLVLSVDEDGNPKGSQRIPACLKLFLVLLLVIIGVTIFLVVSMSAKGEPEDTDDQDGSLVPELEGWSHLGENLMGPISDNARFGFSVSMSEDGNRLAVGLPGADGIDGDSEELRGSGSVHIYDFNGTEWVKVYAIEGPGMHAGAGKSIALSDDGTRFAFSAPDWEEEGFIVVYEEFGAAGNWSVVGEVPLGNPDLEERFGGSLDLSADGRILAVTDKDAMESSGKVRVYMESNRTWELMGTEIEGDSVDGFLGWSVSLSNDGRRLAVAALGYNEFAGEVSVFDFDGESWQQLGSNLEGESDRELFGSAVSLSSDGTTLAVGAPGFAKDDGNEVEVSAGRVRIFRLGDVEGKQSWIELGGPLEGVSSFDAFGTSVALSADGNIVAIGGPDNDTFGENSGHIRVFNFEDSEWAQVGSDLGTPATEGGQFGFSLAISGDARRLAGASPSANFDGFVSAVGEVWAFVVDDESSA